jgi:hypothetical protein
MDRDIINEKKVFILQEIARHDLNQPFPYRKTMVAAVRILIVFLAVSGFCPLTAISERIPRWLDTCNVLFRLTFALVHTYLFSMAPIAVNAIKGRTFQVITNTETDGLAFNKTLFQISLICVRLLMVAYQIAVLPLLPEFGRCSPKLIRLRSRSLVVLTPCFLYIMTIFSFDLYMSNTSISWSHIMSLVFPFISLFGSVAVVTLQTVILNNFKQQVSKIHHGVNITFQ